MKRTILLGLCVLFSLTSNAQLRVNSSGVTYTGELNVHTSNPFQSSDAKGLQCRVDDFLCTQGVGISSYIWAAPECEDGVERIAIALRGEANNSSGHNYGVLGIVRPQAISNTLNYGTAIYGTTNYTLKTFSDNYAGYFDGKVGIKGNLNVTNGYIYGTLYGMAASAMYQTSELETSNFTSSSTCDLLSKLKMGVFDGKEENEADSDILPSDSTNNSDNRANDIHYGICADELEEIFPSLVVEEKDGTKYINYVEMVPLLVQAIKELTSEVAALKGSICELPSQKIAITTGIGERKDDPEIVQMSQNLPNPFIGSTVINLNIPTKAQKAYICIYDLNGKQVQNIPIRERGKTNITIYSHNLQPGMFTYSLVVDGRVSVTRKMIISEI